MNIGIVGYQGDVAEHVELIERMNDEYKREVSVLLVRSVKALSLVSGLIIPGGESTTIYRLIKEFGLFDAMKTRISEGLPVMGTCAGLILISREIPGERVRTLNVLDVNVKRNAYGRQGDSFVDEIDIEGIGSFNAVFIRAPIIERWGNVSVLAKHGGSPVMVRDGNILGLTFHPELTEDSRVHELFMDMIGSGGYPSTATRDMPMIEYV